MLKGQLKGSFFTFFFILLNLFYLVIELSFNARVLDIAGTLSTDIDLGRLEVYGRTISASGATILVWRLLLPYQMGHHIYRLLFRFLLIAIIIFPAVFIGQKKLVDHLVDYSSAETRRSAEVLGLLKYGLANGFVEIEQMALNDISRQTAEGKMFISLSGLLAFNSSTMREVLEEKLDTIAGYAIASQQSQDTEQHYRNYLYIQQQVLEQYKQYLKMVSELDRQQYKAHLQARALYVDAMNRAYQQWEMYLQLREENPDSDWTPSELLEDIADILMSGSSFADSCRSRQCLQEITQRMEMKLSRRLGMYSSLDDWCQLQEVSYRQQPRLACTDSSSDVKERILLARYNHLALQAGLSRWYPDRLSYMKSSEFRSTFMLSLAEYGINGQKDWRFDRYQEILDGMAAQIRMMNRDHHVHLVKQRFGTALEPRSDFTHFNRMTSMQFLYAQVLGGATIEPVGINLSKKEFGDRYISPLYYERYQLLLARLNADPEWFSDNAPYEAEGKSSLRNLLIPPVAIAFSLIFGLLNLISLVLSILFVLVRENRQLRWIGFSLLLGLVVMIPARTEYEIYSQPAYQNLLDQTHGQYGSGVLLLDWLARSEPQVYPFANLLRYYLLDDFSFD